jgi:hypothetical protein
MREGQAADQYLTQLSQPFDEEGMAARIRTDELASRNQAMDSAMDDVLTSYRRRGTGSENMIAQLAAERSKMNAMPSLASSYAQSQQIGAGRTDRNQALYQALADRSKQGAGATNLPSSNLPGMASNMRSSITGTQTSRATPTLGAAPQMDTGVFSSAIDAAKTTGTMYQAAGQGIGNFVDSDYFKNLFSGDTNRTKGNTSSNNAGTYRISSSDFGL